MKQVCINCDRTSTGGNLWCLESYCSLDRKPMVLDYGESLADLVINRLITVLYTSSIYEATRNNERIMLKVAHPGYEERLKREAIFLMELQQSGQNHPMLPALLPAHLQADISTYPYSKTVVQDQTLYYSLFDYSDGDILRGLLLKNPQPWYQHAGWMGVSLTDVIGLMHQNQRLHLSLCPEVILIRFDPEGAPRPLLLDLGAVTTPADVNKHWKPDFQPTAYIAPELIRRDNRRVGVFSDVYGIGLILHEMFAGRAAYPFRLRSDEAVRYDVLNSLPSKMNRPDLKGVPEIVARAIAKDFNRRQSDILTLASELLAHFPPIPKEKKERKFNWNTFAIIVGAAMLIALLLVLAVAIVEAGSA